MNENTELVKRAINLLQKKVRNWKWRTNNALAKELKVDSNILLNELSKHAAKKNREITNLRYPSKKTLDILWGLVEDVGADAADQSNLRREDYPKHLTEEELIEPPYIFLSYNYHDTCCYKNCIDLK